MNDIPRCSYEGSHYQSEFWTSARAYEDRAERLALEKLLPRRGGRLIEIGAGAGRLVDLYAGYDDVYLLDYAHTQLRQAVERVGPHARYVQGDIYNLGFPDNFFDVVVTVRVLHHVLDLPAAFEEISRIVKPGGLYVMEFANKRNLKAILRYLAGRGRNGEKPFSLAPYEFVPLNVDYHPAYVKWELQVAGFVPEEKLAVSHFRLPMLKRLVPAETLAQLDGLLQPLTAPLTLTPSVMLRTRLSNQYWWDCVPPVL